MGYTDFRNAYLVEAEQRLAAIDLTTATTNDLLASGALYKMAAQVAQADLLSPQAIRLLETMSGAQLDTWLQDASNYAAFEQILASSTAMQAVIASSTAMQAVAASSTAMQAVAASSTAMQAVIASSTAMQAVAASSTAMQAVYANPSAVRACLGVDAIVHLVADAGTINTLNGNQITVNGTPVITTQNGRSAWDLSNSSWFDLGVLSSLLNGLQGFVPVNQYNYTAYIVCLVNATSWNALLCNSGSSIYEQINYNNANVYTSNGYGWSSYPSPAMPIGQLAIVRIRYDHSSNTHFISVNGGAETSVSSGASHTLFSGNNIYFGYSNQIGYHLNGLLSELIVVGNANPLQDATIMPMLKSKYGL